MASSTRALRPASLVSRVLAFPTFCPTRTVAVTLRSNCTKLVVMDELAHRVPDRSPPVNWTSTASAFAMSITLSVMALTCSRVYMRGLRGKRVERWCQREEAGPIGSTSGCSASVLGEPASAPHPPFGGEGKRERHNPPR